MCMLYRYEWPLLLPNLLSEWYFTSHKSVLVDTCQTPQNYLSSPRAKLTTAHELTTAHAPFISHGPSMPIVELTGWYSRDNQQAAGVLIKGLKWEKNSNNDLLVCNWKLHCLPEGYSCAINLLHNLFLIFVLGFYSIHSILHGIRAGTSYFNNLCQK